tara:strand:+ start:1948 stop:2409 length:462 start_codon:yes stop_codon:yes gene_type:complete
MNAIGLDLGTHTGWASCRGGMSSLTYGTTNLKFDARFEGGGMRFLRFRQWLKELIKLTNPEAIFYEEVRSHKGTAAAHVYGGLQAILTGLAEGQMIPYTGIPVGTIKMFATGRGNASKAEMIKAANQKYGGAANDNEADAIFCLACGIEGLNA